MSASSNNTIITSSDDVITDAFGNTWQIIDGKVVVNNVVDPTTNNVVLLAYENNTIWQENSDRLWWSKTGPSDTWEPSYGITSSPLVNVASTDNTLLVGSVVAGLTFPHITDANDDKWTITSSGQVAVNGAIDPMTSRVIAIAYENGRIWQENADLLWWSKTSAAASWDPPDGTIQSPVPAGSTSPTVTYLTGSVVDYSNTVSPVEYTVQAVDDGGTAVTFKYDGINTAGGTITNNEGNLDLDVQGTFINSGSIVTQGGIGNAITSINIEAGANFQNTGSITTLRAASTPVGGTLDVTGSGTFYNDGVVVLDGGSNTDFNMTGDIYNSGDLFIDDRFGSAHSIITTGNIVNTGLIQSFNTTLLQWGYVGPTADEAVSTTFTNDGTIKSLSRGSHVTLGAGTFAHNADAYTVHDYHGTLVNNGEILASGGGEALEIAAPVIQGSTGRVDVESGATLKLDATTDGGTINITSGMLSFGGDRVEFYGPAGASGFNSNVVLSGASDAFDFGRSDISAMFKAVSPTSADLIISLAAVGAPQQIADIHLVGDYHASQFQLSGNEVIFTKAA